MKKFTIWLYWALSFVLFLLLPVGIAYWTVKIHWYLASMILVIALAIVLWGLYTNEPRLTMWRAYNRSLSETKLDAWIELYSLVKKEVPQGLYSFTKEGEQKLLYSWAEDASYTRMDKVLEEACLSFIRVLIPTLDPKQLSIFLAYQDRKASDIYLMLVLISQVHGKTRLDKNL